MPVASKRLRHARRIKRQNTLLYRALVEQSRQLEYAGRYCAGVQLVHDNRQRGLLDRVLGGDQAR